jgi:hypothetical protein
MFTVMHNQTAVANCADLNAAIALVKSLESGLDRLISHSPYSIVPATAHIDAHVTSC